uniref:Alpha/beta hydrolase n=1 Tax=Desertifilum tharense IPPAS B-1220 TaxID=1781255 RepID=A0ACD5GX59_9CYAN
MVGGYRYANPETSPGTILYLHGNGINIGANVNHSYRLHSLGFSVFVFDYRGYGWSEGAFPSEQSVYQDAQRAWEYLVNERQIEPSQIYLYGHFPRRGDRHRTRHPSTRRRRLDC